MSVVFKTWKTRDGRVLRIVDMEDDHLVNAIRMLEREAHAKYLTQDTGGLTAVDMVVLEETFFLHRNYDDLVFEARKRGIQL